MSDTKDMIDSAAMNGEVSIPGVKTKIYDVKYKT